MSKEKRYTGPQLETYLKRKVEAAGGRCLKFVSPGFRGVPDRLVLWPTGTAEFVEVKGHGDRATSAQVRAAALLQLLNFEIYTVWSREDIDLYVAGAGP